MNTWTIKHDKTRHRFQAHTVEVTAAGALVLRCPESQPVLMLAPGKWDSVARSDLGDFMIKDGEGK